MSKAKSSPKKVVTNGLRGMLRKEMSKPPEAVLRKEILPVVEESSAVAELTAEVPAESALVLPKEEARAASTAELAVLKNEPEALVVEDAVKIGDAATSELVKVVSPIVETQTVSGEEPLYRRLERKEVRFRADQIEQLTKLARRIGRERRGKPAADSVDRITENTLVRVAVDFLLKYEGQLRGTDESSLLQALQTAVQQRP